jgi:uncharacterized protein
VTARSVRWFLDSLSDEGVEAFGVVDSKSGTYGCLSGCGTEVDHFTMDRLINEAAAQTEPPPEPAPAVAESPWLRADWMQTFTGKAFVPLDPRPDLIDRRDIAHALSLLCRYGGHASRFYSVGEHSLLISRALERDGAPLDVIRWGLMHDAAEAYLGDVIRPVKRSMPIYRDAEARLLEVIAAVFGLPYDGGGREGYGPEVAACDNRILLDERAELLSAPPQKWDQEGLDPLGVQVVGIHSLTVEQLFLERMDELGLTERLV